MPSGRIAPSRATASSSAGRAPHVGSFDVFSRSMAYPMTEWASRSVRLVPAVHPACPVRTPTTELRPSELGAALEERRHTLLEVGPAEALEHQLDGVRSATPRPACSSVYTWRFITAIEAGDDDVGQLADVVLGGRPAPRRPGRPG